MQQYSSNMREYASKYAVICEDMCKYTANMREYVDEYARICGEYVRIRGEYARIRESIHKTNTQEYTRRIRNNVGYTKILAKYVRIRNGYSQYAAAYLRMDLVISLILASAMVLFESIVNTCVRRAGEGQSRTATCDPRGRGLNAPPLIASILAGVVHAVKWETC